MKKLKPNSTKLSQYRLWEIVLLFLIFANVAYFVNNVLGWIVTLVFFLFVPGFLLLKLLTYAPKSFWITTVFSLSLSMLLMMVSGLVLNSLYFAGLHRPLETLNIFITLDILTLILIIFNRNIKFKLVKIYIQFDKLKLFALFVLTSLPLIAAAGAIRLNNGAPNILTLILFATIAVMFVLLLVNRHLKSFYPYALFVFALSVLITISLRGWFVTGADVQREFAVYQLTYKSGLWNISTFRDPYNACLSITILPTIIAKITSIPALLIFKIIFQIIASFMVTPIYFLMRKFSNSKCAFIGAFVFISLPNFINFMTWANRQEIAFLFFADIMLVTFLNIERKTKTILTFLFLISLIMAHYSTAYVTLAVIFVAWMVYKLLVFSNKFSIRDSEQIPLLNISVILFALLITFLWNVQVTTTTSGLSKTISTTLSSMLDDSYIRTGDVSYNLLNTSDTPIQLQLYKYAGRNSNQIEYAPEQLLPLTKLGRKISRIYNVETLNNIIREFSAKILQVLLLVGIVFLLLKYLRATKVSELYFLSLSLSFVILLVLQTLLPELSVSYGTQRLFQQALMILGVPIVVGALGLLSFIHKPALLIVAVFFALLFLDLSGFVPQVLGGYLPQLALNNSGSAYDSYYVLKPELYSANWLERLNNNQKFIALDADSAIRFQIISSFKYIKNTSILDSKNAYLYQDYTNHVNGIYTVDLNSNVIEYYDNYADKGRELIYSNGKSVVYSPALAQN